jgi:hypothetical protein
VTEGEVAEILVREEDEMVDLGSEMGVRRWTGKNEIPHTGRARSSLLLKKLCLRFMLVLSPMLKPLEAMALIERKSLVNR